MAGHAVAAAHQVTPAGEDGADVQTVLEHPGDDEKSTTPDPATQSDADDRGREQDRAVGAAEDGLRSTSHRRTMSPLRAATVLQVALLIALGTLAGWLGLKAHQSHQADQQRALFLQVARQGAVNLTTIDWHHAESDIQRILGSATATFHDDFANRSQPFIDVVHQAQSTSVGTVTEAGLESENGEQAQVLVAVSVKVTAGGAEQTPRAWRMRISVQKVGDDAKVSNVQFVP
jgi:Mce-associated membrane protein